MAPPSRRARQAAAMTLAASASLRVLPLRRVLLVIVFVFVLLPLFVYNVVVTLGYSLGGANAAASSTFFRGAATDPRHAPPPLPHCLNVSSALFLARDGLSRLQSECTSANGSLPATTPEPVAEDSGDSEDLVVHFVHVPLDAVPLLEGEKAPVIEKELVTFLQFAAVQSVRKLVNPRVMLLHYVDREPRGVWYTQCQRHLSLHRVLAPKIAAKATTAGAKSKPKSQKNNAAAKSLNIYQRRQLMEFLIMLRVLQKQGGIAFSDFNTFVLRETLQQTMKRLGRTAVIASQASETAGSGGGETVLRVGVHTLQAPADHEFLKYLEHELLALIAADDPKLHRMPLEQLVGHLTLARYNHEHGTGKPISNRTETATAAPRDVVVGSSSLFEGMPLQRISGLLSARVGEDSDTVNFRGVTAFHMDKYDFHLKRNDTEPLKAIQRLEHTIITAEDILEEEEGGGEKESEYKSLFHALLRFAVGLNTTAELDPHFQ
ncbi:hypothetical protein Gpo141_00011286 [Globisporangium polare]